MNGTATEQTFPARADQMAAVRRFVKAAARGHPQCDNAVLATSEIAADAVEHGGAVQLVVSVAVDAAGVHVRITGGTPPPATAPTPGQDSTRGRGLGIVAALATRHTVSSGSAPATTALDLP